jgi:hypothetical protein
MPTILYDVITGSKSPNGTWLKVSGPALPVAPGLYDGALDFTGADEGIHSFRYTVLGAEPDCFDTSIVNINITSAPPVFNDDCIDSLYIEPAIELNDGVLTITGVEYGIFYINSNENTPDVQQCKETVSTVSDIPVHPWSMTPGGDIWFKMALPVALIGFPYNLNVTADSSSVSQPLQTIMVGIYTSSVLNPVDCTGLTLEYQGIFNNTVSGFVVLDSSADKSLYIRVGCLPNMYGNFTLRITPFL